MSSARKTAPRAAAIYCRISLDRAGDGLGVERQEALCRKLATERGWPVAEVYVDNDRSAYSGKPRAAYQRMLADLGAGLRDAVVCVDLDRLTRRPAELEAFMDLADTHRVALANVSGDTDLSSSDGRFKARIMGAVARQESERKGERVSREAEQAARRGVPRGSRRPFGYEPDRVTVREDEAALIKDAVERVLAGVSLPSIARDWNALGISTPQGALRGWSGTSVVEVLRNPRIAGLRTYHGEVVSEGVWPAIVDRETFERLQVKIRRSARPGRPARRLLSGIARCGLCGSPMWTSTHQRAGGRRVPRYACMAGPGKPGCGSLAILAEPLDQLLTEAVLHRLGTKAMARALSRKPKRTPADVDVARLEHDLEDLAADFGNGDITRREWLAARKPLEDRLAKARRAVDATNGTAALEPFRGGDVRVAWERLDVDRQRAVLDALIERVLIRPATMLGRFSPDRVDVVWRA
ncbi:MAG TPA: recombinase family protein [Acidimicrobiia bacterium]|nr:recombinase family protein [Acidimicrobiia bacterium]